MSWALECHWYLGQQGGKKESHGWFVGSVFSACLNRDLQKVETNGNH